MPSVTVTSTGPNCQSRFIETALNPGHKKTAQASSRGGFSHMQADQVRGIIRGGNFPRLLRAA